MRNEPTDYYIVSRATYDRQKKGWLVRVNISWQEDGGRLCMNKLSAPKIFDTIAQATNEAFRLAELWIDERNSLPPEAE